MNDVTLQQLAQEIAKQTAINNWQFYVVLLALSFVGATLGSFFKARFTKRGEVSATKADTAEILRQLEKTTAAAKSVELSLSRGDWIQREKNTLKRAKLEELVVSSFSISRWVAAEARCAAVDEHQEDSAPIDTFEMLSILYFPELREQSKRVEEAYREAFSFFMDLRIETSELKAAAETASRMNRREEMMQKLENRKRLIDQNLPMITERHQAVSSAVRTLARAAHGLMEQLTSQPPATQ